MLRGLPASGKSTWAREQVANGKWMVKRVNKDDLRAMIDNSEWSKNNEKSILIVRDKIIASYLEVGCTVIVDDTNFSPAHEYMLKGIATNEHTKFEIKDFDTPVEECIRRDSLRPNPVGEKVILDMYHKYKQDHNELKDATWNTVICDIDWTLAFMKDRWPYDRDKVWNDICIEQVRLCLKGFEKMWKEIVIFSGRDSICEDTTRVRLADNSIPYDDLYMRAEWDVRSDAVIKKEFLDKIGKENVFAVIDDRPKVIRMRQEEWLFVFNVGSGREF